MACNPLTSLAKNCGRTNASGIRDEVYLVPFSELATITGSTEVFTVGVGGLISAIAFTTGSTKFVKYSAVKNQNTITETYKLEDTGSYSITKELTFTLGNLGDVLQKAAVENLMSNPVAVLTKMKNGSWIAFGLNGQFSMSAAAGSVAAAANQRVVTLTGEDTEFLQLVDPTVVSSFLSLV